MTIKYKLALVLLAVLLALPLLVSAIELNLIKGSDRQAYQYDVRDFYSSEIRILQDKAIINISAKKLVPEKIFIYLCKSGHLVNCVKTEPLEYTGPMYSVFKLKDVAAVDGKVFALIKSGGSLVGELFEIKNRSVASNNIGKLDVFYSKGLEEITGSISKSGLLHLQLIDSIKTGSPAVQVSLDIVGDEKPNITEAKQITGINKFSAFSLVFPDDGKSKPVALDNRKTECGNSVCENGESYQMCWQDCECPNGQVAYRSGCGPKSGVELKIKSIEPSPYQCAIKDGSCYGFPNNWAKVEIEAENEPLDYQVNDCFFSVGTEQSTEIACSGGATSFNISQNSKCMGISKCSLLVPVLKAEDDFSGNKTLLINFPITIRKSGGIEKINLTAKGTLPVIGQDFLKDIKKSLSDYNKAQKNARDVAKKLEPIIKVAEYLGYASLVTSVVSCLACAGFGAGCETCALSVKSFIVSQGIQQTGQAAIKWCTGKYGGEGSNVMKSVSSTCRRIQEFDNNKGRILKGAAEQAIQEAQESLPEFIWVNGNLSGERTGSVCNGEGVEMKYNFAGYNCTPLKLGLVSGENIFNSSLEKTSVLELGHINGTQILLNATASGIFSKLGSGNMSIRVSCKSPEMGDIEDTFHILEYKESCGEIGKLLGGEE